jgi:hypothetical protein
LRDELRSDRSVGVQITELNRAPEPLDTALGSLDSDDRERAKMIDEQFKEQLSSQPPPDDR